MQKSRNSDPPGSGTRPWVIIGNPENRRVTMFCETLRRLDAGEAIIIPYTEISSYADIFGLFSDGIIRIESPGENDKVRRALITCGSGKLTIDDKEGFGAICNMVAWYKGFRTLMEEIDTQAFLFYPASQFMNQPLDIALLFDKSRCQAHLQQHNIPMPGMLTTIEGYDDLLKQMAEHRLQKVFIKPAHASSASGVIAFRKMGDKVQAVTSVEMVDSPNGLELYNSLTVRTYTSEKQIAVLIDRIIKENVQVQEWLPKATLNDRFFDIRVLVIAGKARHTVLRTSRNVITNLHLGNKRGDMSLFIAKFGENQLKEIKSLAERTAACFPNSLYMGVDILLTPDGKTFVLEVNAFGDLLPGLLDEGETCYEAEINAAKSLYI